MEIRFWTSCKNELWLYVKGNSWENEAIWRNTNENYVHEKLRTDLVLGMSAAIHSRNFRLPIFCHKHYD